MQIPGERYVAARVEGCADGEVIGLPGPFVRPAAVVSGELTDELGKPGFVPDPYLNAGELGVKALRASVDGEANAVLVGEVLEAPRWAPISLPADAVRVWSPDGAGFPVVQVSGS
ncbi:hypothetical protein Raf01_96710 [Rugosimonospora africana]|uniref:Uncharacterized protein n=1 Tax=Rugosimonospora africana TaxID=556532 RepID=A0A8J3R1R8_9ACTN|nr:hypothetical protein Raf01_96710 [Rugosimonospora africana]